MTAVSRDTFTRFLVLGNVPQLRLRQKLPESSSNIRHQSARPERGWQSNMPAATVRHKESTPERRRKKYPLGQRLAWDLRRILWLLHGPYLPPGKWPRYYLPQTDWTIPPNS